MQRMRSRVTWAGWVLAGLAGAVLLVWAYPRATPFRGAAWRLTGSQAEAIALDRLRVLGPPVADAYVVVRPYADSELECWLEQALRQRSLAELRATGLPERLSAWEVFVYPPGAQREQWTYRALISHDGRVLGLSFRLDPNVKAAAISQAEATRRAVSFLRRQQIDLGNFGAPEARLQQLAERSDFKVRFPGRQKLPGKATYGVEVEFAGDRFAGFMPWMDDPDIRGIQGLVQISAFVGFWHLVAIYLLTCLLAIPFLRRYHEGVVGVGRAVQIFLLVIAANVVTMLLTARADSQGAGFGFATRQQTTFVVGLFSVFFFALPASILCFFAWSVGESMLRQRWGRKLAAFDALFQRQWRNATVARSSLVGVMSGLAGAGLLSVLLLPARRYGIFALTSERSLSTGWPAIELVGMFFGFSFPMFLAIVLWITPLAIERLGRRAGVIAAVVLGALIVPLPILPLPVVGVALFCALYTALAIALFLYQDLLSVLLAGIVAHVLLVGFPLFTAANPYFVASGWLALGLAAAPLLVSVRWLGSGREFTYRYEDIPPHVRRIADRERQRVELETARRIQSSILPDLPPRLNGVDLAHAYLPASEVGGDFYDVLALEDGRLAVAVGDVAGHGVSSGLVMSMAKSALAVQVTFNPEVLAVFETLNRTVFQTARKRLLATCCYALLDPLERELLFASAGHLYPYRISAEGVVEALESIGYPLGVRRLLDVHPQRHQLHAGDTLFFFSDGLVEARRPASEDLYGFDRLEQSLARHAGGSVEALRDGVLADINRFTRDEPREDDQTILVLRLP
jgi:hypothetical protein